MEQEYLERLSKISSSWSITLDEEQLQQFSTYYDLLISWNEKMNLTSITSEEDVLIKHFVDSLSFAKVMDLSQVRSLIDVGTGAGFPGIPLKIAFPHLRVVLLDSLQKRLTFLETVISELGLNEISTLHSRAEDAGRIPSCRESFDLVLSRAVASLPTLLEYCLPLVRTGGTFCAYKSGEAEDEVRSSQRALALLGGKLDKVSSFILPDSDYGRSLVLISKVHPTSKRYPRQAGLPKKKPLL